MLIVDSTRHQVLQISREGDHITPFVGTGHEGATLERQDPSATQLSSPLGVSVLPDGRSAIADTNNNRILVVDTEGSSIVDLMASIRVGNDKFLKKPEAVVYLPDGRILISDTGHHRVLAVGDPRGHPAIAEIGRSHGASHLNGAKQIRLRSPQGIAFHKGNVLVADKSKHRVFEFPAPELQIGWWKTGWTKTDWDWLGEDWLGDGVKASSSGVKAASSSGSDLQLEKQQAIVSLGDGYLSGEAGRWLGNGSLTSEGYGGIDRAHNPGGDPLTDPMRIYGKTAFWGEGQGCHRSDTAPIISSNIDGVRKINIACSGARTQHVLTDSFKGEDPQVAQLQWLSAEYDIKMVVVSVGETPRQYPDFEGE